MTSNPTELEMKAWAKYSVADKIATRLIAISHNAASKLEEAKRQSWMAETNASEADEYHKISTMGAAVYRARDVAQTSVAALIAHARSDEAVSKREKAGLKAMSITLESRAQLAQKETE